MQKKIWSFVNTIILMMLIILMILLGLKIYDNVVIHNNSMSFNNADNDPSYNDNPYNNQEDNIDEDHNDIVRSTVKKNPHRDHKNNNPSGTIYPLQASSSHRLRNVGVMPGTPIAIVTSRDSSSVSYERCTVSFSLPGKSGYPWGITAGHCGNIGDKVYTVPKNNEWSSSHFLGTIRYKSKINSSNGDGDWAAIRLSTKAKTPLSHNNVPMQLNTKNVKEGSSVCKAGSRTGYSCGMQGDKNVKAILSGMEEDTQTSGYLDEIKKICALPGDSGSPVFSDFGIVGVLSSTGASEKDSETGICSSPSSAYYVPIDQVVEQIQDNVPDIIFKKTK